MILTTLRQLHCLPKVVIYGITPRDFINNGLFCPASSPVFQFLDQCFDVGFFYADVYDNKINPLYAILKEHIYLFREGMKLQNLFSIWWQKQVPPLSVGGRIGSNPVDPAGGELPSEQQLQEELGEQLPNKRATDEYVQSKQKSLASDLQFNSLAYVPFPNYIYKQQLRYFQKMISFCRSEGIHLVVVNMPTSREHIELVGDGRYKDYLSTVRNETIQGGCQFIDMNTLEPFSYGHFYDSIHLNPVGAKLFITDLVKNLSFLCTPLLASIDQRGYQFSKHLVNNEQNPVNQYSTWWLEKAYVAETKPPEIVLLGNSQLGPVIGADAYVYNKRVDVTGNHRSYVLEHDIRVLLNKQWKVFVGALPEAMISDQLVISRALFSRQYKPILVALAISPINFIDNMSPSPTSTETFAFFKKYNGLGTEADLFRVRDNIDSRSEYISPIVLGKPFKRICPGQVIINSADGQSFADNTEEYRVRYKNPDLPQSVSQMNSFEGLLKYLSQQRIKVVVFGMPLTTSNKQLLPQNFWSQYNQQIAGLCKKYDADWIDINSYKEGFPDSEFMDGIHLNLHGGFKLSYEIAMYVANKFHYRPWAELQKDEAKLF